MRTLRSRLVLSHTLPMLILVPLIGVLLIYLLETQVLLASVSDELTRQARLIADLAGEQRAIWYDRSQAQLFVTSLNRALVSRVMVVSLEGSLLASTDPADVGRIGEQLALPGMMRVRTSETSVHSDYVPMLRASVMEVLVPVLDVNDHPIGAILLTHQLAGMTERFTGLRYLIVGVLAVELVLGGVVGWGLALNLTRSLSNLTRSVDGFSRGEEWAPQPEQGPQEVRLLQHAFNTLVERLRAGEETRRQLVANLVHELGRPLGALLSAIQALLSGGADETGFRQELVVGMEAEVQRLRRLLDDLARLREQPAGGPDLVRQPVDLALWLPQVLGTWREAAQEKGLDWEVGMTPDLPPAMIDPDRLGQAVGNLLSNAIKYTPAGGKVTVGTGIDPGGVWIRVGDTGPGIPPEEQGRIFEPFHRAQSGRRFPQGMGLGLTIARDLVIAHGGRLEVASAPGGGSRFTIWVPAGAPSQVRLKVGCYAI